MLMLRVISGRRAGDAVGVPTGARLVIGRDLACDLRIADAEVSRRHCEVEARPDGLRVRDLGSVNGTFVDDARLERGVERRLGPGARLRVGACQLECVTGDFAKPPPLVRLEAEPAAAAPVLGMTDDTARIDMSSLGLAPKVPGPAPVAAAGPGPGPGPEERLKTVYRVGRAVSGARDLGDLFEQVLDTIFEALAPERAFVLLAEPYREGPPADEGAGAAAPAEVILEPVAARCRDGSPPRATFDTTIVRETLARGVPVETADLRRRDELAAAGRPARPSGGGATAVFPVPSVETFSSAETVVGPVPAPAPAATATVTPPPGAGVAVAAGVPPEAETEAEASAVPGGDAGAGAGASPRERSAACAPIPGGDRPLGVVYLDSSVAYAFDAHHLELLAQIGRELGFAVEKEHLLSDLEELFFSTVMTLVAAIDAKDRYTAGHSERVMMYAVALARRLGLAPRDREVVKLAALFHDVGKIGIPESILNKPARLSPEEATVMRTHPQIGADIVARIRHRAMRAVSEAVLRHHERWDGTGFPGGLTGEAIPLVARIVAVADAFDAMTTSRSYATERAAEVVIAEIANHAGTHFDPAVATPFVELVRSGEIRPMAIEPKVLFVRDAPAGSASASGRLAVPLDVEEIRIRM